LFRLLNVKLFKASSPNPTISNSLVRVDLSLPPSIIVLHSDILNFFTRCANIKSLLIAECDFSSIIAIGELRDTDIVCNLEFLRLEVSDSIHYENITSSTKQASTDAGEAIKSLTRIFSSQFDSFLHGHRALFLRRDTQLLSIFYRQLHMWDVFIRSSEYLSKLPS
jgi:hypothetical protein